MGRSPLFLPQKDEMRKMTTPQLAHITSYLLTWEQFAGDTLAAEITTEDKDKCIALAASGWWLQNAETRFIP